MGVTKFLAGVFGRGSAMRSTAGTGWFELRRKPLASLDASSWLWNSLMDLVVVREAS